MEHAKGKKQRVDIKLGNDRELLLQWCRDNFEYIRRIDKGGNNFTYYPCCNTFMGKTNKLKDEHRQGDRELFSSFKLIRDITKKKEDQGKDEEEVIDLEEERFIEVMIKIAELNKQMPSINAEHESKAELKATIEEKDSNIDYLEKQLDKLETLLSISEAKAAPDFNKQSYKRIKDLMDENVALQHQRDRYWKKCRHLEDRITEIESKEERQLAKRSPEKHS